MSLNMSIDDDNLFVLQKDVKLLIADNAGII